MATAAGAPLHSINGGIGTDTISAISNVFSADKVLDLRNATLQSIEGLTIEGGLTVRLLGSQIGTGLSSVAVVSNNVGVGSGNAIFEVVLGAPGTANLSGFTFSAGVSITVFGSAGADTISGTGIGETIRGDAGADTINGNGGNDLFVVNGTEGEFDALNGGAGTDTLQAGAGAITLNAFNAAAASIEAWLGNGQGLFGNSSANVFNLAGLAAMSGLPFVDGGAGNDAMTGSGFADVLRGGLGVDTMAGGLGGDRFDFDASAEIGKKKGLLDLISDFADGDTIDLSTIDANGAKKGDKAFKFLKKEGADFTNKAGQLAYDQKKGMTLVQGDTNGDGKADFVLQLAGLIDLDKADFVL
jgi:Ca2+-binding RTX toxin-like protein